MSLSLFEHCKKLLTLLIYRLLSDWVWMYLKLQNDVRSEGHRGEIIDLLVLAKGSNFNLVQIGITVFSIDDLFVRRFVCEINPFLC